MRRFVAWAAAIGCLGAAQARGDDGPSQTVYVYDAACISEMTQRCALATLLEAAPNGASLANGKSMLEVVAAAPTLDELTGVNSCKDVQGSTIVDAQGEARWPLSGVTSKPAPLAIVVKARGWQASTLCFVRGGALVRDWVPPAAGAAPNLVVV